MAEYDPDTHFLNSTLSRTAVQGTAFHEQSYTFDRVGNLTSRRVHGLQATPQEADTYGYDAANRLPTRNNTAIATYDCVGRIQWQAGVGDFTYAGTGGGVRPHAVTATSTGGHSVAYDANGRMTSRSVGQLTGAVTWTSFNVSVQ